MLDPTRKVIRVFNIKWNKEKCPADTTPENKPCSKRMCIQEPNQPKASSAGEKTINCTSFSSLVSAIKPIKEPIIQHSYATRFKTQSDTLSLIACLANTKNINIAKPKTYNKAAKCFE